MHFVTVTILSLIFPATCVATLYEAFNHLPTSNFDFIIVGGVDAFFFHFVMEHILRLILILQLGLRGA
jgi:hypothetical protein